MLKTEDCFFVLVDVQGNLAQSMMDSENLFTNLGILVKGMEILGIPIIWVEQTPDKLGPTIPELSALLPGQQPISKSSFSCLGCDAFHSELKRINRPQAIIAGIESHVCVYQTTRDLIEQGYLVEVATDAVSSRTTENRKIGLKRMKQAGAVFTSTEMLLFELMKDAEHAMFREIIKLVK